MPPCLTAPPAAAPSTRRLSRWARGLLGRSASTGTTSAPRATRSRDGGATSPHRRAAPVMDPPSYREDGDAHHVSGAAVTKPSAYGRVDLYWLPLGAGGHSVRLNGRAFEAVAARLERRRPCDLYHSALEVEAPEGRFVIEQAPVRDGEGADRGVVAEGAVGGKWAGRFRLLRYEVRCWRDGCIPDVGEAVGGALRVSNDVRRAQRLLRVVPSVPTFAWGRDEFEAGEMWNSNSVTSWLLVRSGIAVEAISLPTGGRAPGWNAGVAVARRAELEAPKVKC